MPLFPAFPLLPRAALSAKRRDLDLTAREERMAVDSVCSLFAESPLGFAAHEQALLWVARAALESQRQDVFADVASLWRDREAASGAWRCLAADALVQQDKRDDAREMLEAQTLCGDHEGGRLARLAALQVDSAPEEARANMLRALAAAPNNPEVCLHGSRVLEHLGEVPKAAKLVAHAVALAPRDPFVRSRAGDFFRHEGNLMRALQIWSDGLEPPSTGSLWLKTLFWHKVALPVPVNFERKPLPESALRPVIDLLLTLSLHRFWDEQAFAPIAKRAPDLARRQEVYWLRLLEYMRAGHHGRALALIHRARPGLHAWHPQLESALRQIATFRVTGVLNKEAGMNYESPTGRIHPFFISLDQWARKGTTYPTFEHLMLSDDVLAAACFAAGWDEAGLRVQYNAHFRDEFPPWYTRDLHAAWLGNGSKVLAARFAKPCSVGAAADP